MPRLPPQWAREAGIVLQVGYWRRFVPELRALREEIAAGKLGEVNQLMCNQWDEEPPSTEFRTHSGGIAIDMGVHEFDQIRWLLGQEFDSLSAVRAGRDASGDASPEDPDAAAVLAGLSGGAAGIVTLGRRFPHADSCWLEVWGTSGYERLPFMWDAAVWEGDRDEVFLGAMIAQAEAFARALRGEPQEGAGGKDAVAALSVAERVTEALALLAVEG
jgi:myo-inositol 2-dehydrogenase / D-chiro-inositol 1-dehydrogenase